MKLNEIHVVTASHEEYAPEKIKSVELYLASLPTLKKLPHDMELKREGKENPFYFLLKKGKLVGWIKFKKVKIANEDFNKLELIYISPEFRKGVAGSYLILHMKDLSRLPIVVGGVEDQGGVVFKDGAELISALRKRKDLFDISLLNLKTGERSPLPPEITTNKNATIVIENLLPPGLNEQFALPSGVDIETFDERQDWLGDVTVTN
jgi:hypothetical protein